MRRQMIKVVLWFHTTIMTLAGLSLFIFPKTFGIFWPWALPPLAARFMGALLIGGGVCTALAALAAGPIPVEGAALLGVGDLLIVSVALLNKGEISFSGNTIIWLTVFTGMALLLLSLPLLRGRQMTGEGDQLSPMRGLNRYFLIHLAVVIPVGLTMYLIPGVGQKLWPWKLSLINIQLLGAFFVGASILSFWSLRQRNWHMVLPLIGLYAVFTTLATLASIIHFNLFNARSVITWLFFALYIFVALGAWYFLWRGVRLQNQLFEASVETP